MTSWEVYLKEHESRYLEEMLEFLRIPSISALSEHAGDVKRAGKWVATRLQSAGMENVQLLETGGHPAVYGEWLHAPGKPTVMFYGHFDVQPVDPIDLWSHPPFEPAVKDDRIYARGASDNKGNLLIPIIAAESLLKSEGALPLNIKFFCEGQEEIGSPQMPNVIPSQKELLACDLIVSADGSQWDEDQPALLIGLRGLCAIQIDVKGTISDVHSGSCGGAFLNPIHALVQIVNSMRGPDGKVLVEGFYDDVRPLTDIERSQMNEIPFDENDYKNELGVNELFGEPGYTTYERLWSRPTLDVNGIWGGFQGEGLKTVIPSEAHAKISCRLVADQDPEKIRELLINHVDKYAPSAVKIVANPITSKAEPYLVPADHPGNDAAKVVLQTLYGKEPYYARMGGTIPVCSLLLKTLGAYTINFAFGLKDENVHAPDEFFRLSSFKQGQKAYCMLLEELSRRILK
jgi:acetylornithine deacetylase/succinyl-diaminopimelate desuccinylase-like protein